MRMNMSIELPKSASEAHFLGCKLPVAIALHRPSRQARRGKTDRKGGCIAVSNAEREGSVLT